MRVEIGPKRVRALFGGVVVADTTEVRLVWEHPYYPTYYFPAGDVRTDLLEEHEGGGRADGGARVLTVGAGGDEAAGAARWYEHAGPEELRDTIRLEWSAMQAWFEEDEEVYVHVRDPYKRIDILQSSRHVRIEVDGQTVAESRQPRVLFETGLPRRFYVPKTDVRMDLFEPTTTRTRCPYKGIAEYYAVRVGATTHPDLAWWYRHPAPESVKIAGYVCFYDERVDVFVDGTLQERPRTPFA